MGRDLRVMMAAGVLLLGAVGCTTSPPTVTPAPATENPAGTETATAQAEPLTVEVVNTDVSVGFERVAFRLKDASGVPVSTAASVQGTFNRVSQIAPDQRVAQKVASGEAAYFGADLPSGGAWAVYSEFDASGPWWFDVTATVGDWTGAGRAEIDVNAKSGTPRVGDPPPSLTPKIGPDTPLSSLTSDPDPLEALYTRSLADAKAAGKPAVVLFASAKHCPEPACEATLQQFKTAQANMGSQAVFVQVETHDLDDPSQLSETATAWGLTTEPWTFVLSKRGFITARIEGELTANELQLLLEREQSS
jgi:hypothetical protein